jgi:hypothetical protein
MYEINGITQGLLRRDAGLLKAKKVKSGKIRRRDRHAQAGGKKARLKTGKRTMAGGYPFQKVKHMLSPPQHIFFYEILKDRSMFVFERRFRAVGQPIIDFRGNVIKLVPGIQAEHTMQVQGVADDLPALYLNKFLPGEPWQQLIATICAFIMIGGNRNLKYHIFSTIIPLLKTRSQDRSPILFL